MTQSLQAELDVAHSHLLRAVFNVNWSDRVRNDDLYRRAGLRPPSVRLRKDRRIFVGDLFRTEVTCPQPLQKFLLWQPTERQRRGQGRRMTFPELLFQECNAPDTAHPLACSFVRRLLSQI